MAILVIITCVSLYIQAQSISSDIDVEAFDYPVPIKYEDTAKTKLIFGYYKIDETSMMPIPYGYELDKTDPTNKKIKPKTTNAKQSVAFNKIPILPPHGRPIPDGYYKLKIDDSPEQIDLSLGVLPTNMMPKVKRVDMSYNPYSAPKLLIYYDQGYVTSKEYYDKTFPTPNSLKTIVAQSNPPPYSRINPPPESPPTMYFVDNEFNNVSFLPYGKIQDPSKGYGYVGNPSLISQTGNFDYTTTNYRGIADNYDINYHTPAEDFMKDPAVSDVSFSTMTIYDKQGNKVTIPYNSVQGTVMYYEPGSFPFGGSTYIPKYEDSVYMSRTSQLATTSPYISTKGALGACQAYKDLPAQNEEYCRSLDANTCSSTTCCVLLGGSKCVSGSETGPVYKNNYGDFLLRNRDSYYYNGKCYGNC